MLTKARLLGASLGAGLASMLLSGSALAVYTIDAGVQEGITDLLGDFITGAFAIIVVAIGIVGGYYVTVRLVHVLLRWFHKFA